MILQEFVRESTKVASKLWTCNHCGLVEQVDSNPATGFADWSGTVVCPDCNSNMKRKEDTNETMGD
jgi:rubredoxin